MRHGYGCGGILWDFLRWPLGCSGSKSPPQATNTHDYEVARLAERTLRAMGILRPAWCGFSASIECMGCIKAIAHRELPNRQTEHRGQVAAYLTAVNLEVLQK